jgi:hypothetical protein
LSAICRASRGHGVRDRAGHAVRVAAGGTHAGGTRAACGRHADRVIGPRDQLVGGSHGKAVT